MQLEQDKISSYYHSSSKPTFFFYRVSVIVSMVALLGVLSFNLYTLNQTTSTTSEAAEPTTTQTVLSTPTPIQANSTSINNQTLPPLPEQCHYEGATEGNVIKCTEDGKTCTYRIVNNKYAMECDK